MGFQRGRAQEPTISWNEVSCLNIHNVARDQLSRGYLAQRSIANDSGLWNLHVGERVHAGAGFHLLLGAHDDVDHHEQSDQDASTEFTDQHADDRDGHQHQVHGVFELDQRDRPY